MGSDREQELGRTATLPAGSSASVVPAGATLGRYRLERELGAGAMGVVHAAFDPDLERRIALKVLRGGTATPQAKDRLMREARAMARLSHPNVVTVHEVGTAGGRDFVAMELIHGESLAEWLRHTRRPAPAILDAFLAAGRGLAAAHAAGIVHRDFKPHNVLRSRDGRIVVTDFGLAREADGARPPALDMTLPAGLTDHSLGSSTSPSALAGITVTGALLGTPAYMAPEQWHGGAVTPATDQFAYCVALWEALSGERPYRGPTFDDLRGQVARGPAALDASRIPRRVRGILRRGLDPEPSRRWPGMDALLTRLSRAQRRRDIAIRAAVGAITGTALVLAMTHRAAPPPAPVCDPPARDLAAVWSPALAAALRAETSAAHEAVFAAAFGDWQTARAQACTAPREVRQAQLQCLDGVLGRFDALRQAFSRVPGAAAETIQANLVDAAVCHKPAAAELPRLTLAATPDVIAAWALYGRSQTDDKPADREILALVDAAAADPCARVIATFALDDAARDAPRVRAAMSSAVALADHCGDERLRADLLIRSVPHQREHPMSGPRGAAAIEQAEVAAARVMQPDLAAAIAALRVVVARQRDQWDEVFRLSELEIDSYGKRGMSAAQLEAAVTRSRVRIERSEPSDLEAVAADLRTWRPVALASHRADLAWQLDYLAACARFFLGDVASAHRDLLRLWPARPRFGGPDAGRTVQGEVVDDHGRPVAGATVAASFNVFADSIGIGLPILDDELRITTTDAAGRFVLQDVSVAGPVVAQLGDLRSRPVAIADRVTLTLVPTRTVSGKVDLGGVTATHVAVVASSIESAAQRFFTVMPVARDGSFSISGVAVDAVLVRAVVKDSYKHSEGVGYQRIPASPRSVSGVALAITASTRALEVVVRSAVAAPLEGAAVYVLSGRWQIKNFGELFRSPSLGVRELHAQPVGSDGVPASLTSVFRPGDLLMHVEGVASGDLTICAGSFPGDVADPAVLRGIRAHLTELVMACKQIGPDAGVVVLEVPPQQRFDYTRTH